MPKTKRKSTSAPKRRLTPRQERFVREYLIDLNAHKAAVRAGYSPRSARTVGPDTLTNPVVADAVAAAMARRADRTDVTADRVLTELARIAFANLGAFVRTPPNGDPYVTLEGATEDQLAALSEITVEDFRDGRGEDAREVSRVRVKLADKKGALDLLAKHLGLYAPDRLLVQLGKKPEDMTDEELEEAIAHASAAAGRAS